MNQLCIEKGLCYSAIVVQVLWRSYITKAVNQQHREKKMLQIKSDTNGNMGSHSEVSNMHL